jgi:DNA-binding GntR family transcriptional regulator
MKKEKAARGPLAPIERSSTVLEIESRLRAKILEGWFMPGERLRESVLSVELEVSRNSLREALRGLVAQGLARYEPDRGFSVTKLDHDAVLEILRLREWIEELAVARALPQIRRLVPELRRIAEEISDAARRRDWPALYDGDLRFHAAIVAVLDSPRLDAFYRSLWQDLQLTLTSNDRQRPTGSYGETHATLVDALDSSPAAAREAISEHIGGTVDHLGLTPEPPAAPAGPPRKAAARGRASSRKRRP